MLHLFLGVGDGGLEARVIGEGQGVGEEVFGHLRVAGADEDEDHPAHLVDKKLVLERSPILPE